jgi:hypothetical protein
MKPLSKVETRRGLLDLHSSSLAPVYEIKKNGCIEDATEFMKYSALNRPFVRLRRTQSIGE